jgi:riboflavin transporter
MQNILNYSSSSLFSAARAASSENPISSLQAILFFFAMVGIIIVFSFMKKLYYRYRYNKRYFVLPRISVRGISYVGMVIAVSVSAIIIIAAVTSGISNTIFRAFPGSRVAIESVLIKIGGLLFGPLLGMFIGAAVDFLAVALSGGVFHYGYLISAMAFGVFAGLVKTIIIYSGGNNFRFGVYSTIILTLVGLGISVMIYYVRDQIPDSVSFGFWTIPMDWKYLLAIVISLFGFILISVWLLYLLSLFNPKIKSIYKFLAPVILMVSLSEVAINLILLPVFDAEINNQPYWVWFAGRFITLPLVTIVNIVVLFSVYRIVAPLVKYDYTTDMFEDYERK